MNKAEASATQVLARRVEAWLRELGDVRVAVSGGVDSLTLALLAGRALEERALMLHALSPAVPEEATSRTQRLARQEGWSLQYIVAGEFEDERYLANPHRRCYHCKQHLYAAMSRTGRGQMLSGTNPDDMDDFRPGLEAAREYGVRHPFVECGLNNNNVRRLCDWLGQSEIAELPASPCLSSRVETGLRIQASTLRFIHQVETGLRDGLDLQVVRCRVRPEGIEIQLDLSALEAMSAADRDRWTARILHSARALGLPEHVDFTAYRMGSASVSTG